MTIQLFNTMSGRLEPLRPIDPGRIRLYTCGPTVHDRAHIGNLRTYLLEDLLRRHLEYRGLAVRHVMNITDVDDKIIGKAAAAGSTIEQFTEPYIEAFFDDLRQLGIEPAQSYPRATQHVPGMIALVERLLANGHAYQSEGSVYFRVSSFPAYGRLSRLDVAGLLAGGSGRVDSDEYEVKEQVRDFVLWKAGREGDLASWPSPFGWGRPGWHLECSAMAMAELGETIDIHCGGVDNKFPHHENEIAQSESATGRPFVHLWFHCEHLVVQGGKMAKSLGNFVTLGDLLRRGRSPLPVRYHLLASGAHYRSRLAFREGDLDGAAKSLQILAAFWIRCRDSLHLPAPDGGADPLVDAAERARERFDEEMDNDLQLPQAMPALHELVRTGNRYLDQGRSGGAGCEAALSTLKAIDTRLAVIERAASAPVADLTAEEAELVALRDAAKCRRDFSEADRLREQLATRGIQLEDTKAGTRWRRA